MTKTTLSIYQIAMLFTLVFPILSNADVTNTFDGSVTTQVVSLGQHQASKFSKSKIDLELKQDVTREASNYLQLVSTLRADYKTRFSKIQKLMDTKEQSSQVRELLTSLMQKIVKGDKGQLNFVLATTNEVELPFKLLGIQLPDSVKGIGVEIPEDYENYFNNHPEIFNNQPINLAYTIGINLESIILDADLAIIQYLTHWRQQLSR